METGLPKDQTTSEEEKTRLQKELKSRTETLGEDVETIHTMYKLAYLLKCRGEYEEAAELLRKAVAILETQLGGDHKQTIHFKECLAIVLTDATEHEETEIVLRQILESKERMLGKENAETLRWVERLAWNLFSQGKYNKVRELYPPPPRKKEPGVIVLEMNDTSRLDELEKIYRGSAALKTRMLGEEHPDTLASMDKLAKWLKGHCRWVEAETLYRQVVATRKKVLEPDDRDSMDSMSSLAGTLSDQGKYSDALEVLQELLGLQEKIYGGEHPEAMKTTGALAIVFKELGRLSDAADTLRKLVDMQSNINGEGHLETLDTASNLAIVVGEQEQYAEAEKIFRQVVELRAKVLGKNHAKTLTSLSYLAVMLQKQGRGAEAEVVLGGYDEGKDEGKDNYSYHPLSSAGSTRIIKVYPSRDKNAALVCELSEEVLNDNDPPSYAAISYVWGSQTADKRIFCHGKKFLVTENVEGIIRQFRRSESISYLWIDAISIDQSSLKERSQQTRIMEDIYRLAEVVVVWLGPSTEVTADAFKYFENGVSVHKEIAVKVSDPSAPSKDILERPWFSRMWTVQEVGMSSPGAAVLCCGERMMKWETFATTLSRRSNDQGIPAPARRAVQIFYRLDTLFQSLRGSYGQPGAVGPQQLLRSFTPLAEALKIFVEIRERASTDPRDKVFALHGILKSIGTRFPDPDYSKSTERVFCETAEAIIKHDAKPHILYHVSSPARLPKLPTWVPDWSDQDVIDNAPPYEYYQASGISREDCTFSTSGDRATLHITGKVIDRISNRAEALSEETSLSSDDLEVFQDWVRCCQSLASRDRTPGTWEATFYQNLVQVPPTDDGMCIPLRSSFRDKTSFEAFEVWVKVVIESMKLPRTNDTAGGNANNEVATATSCAPEHTPGTSIFHGSAKTFHDTIRGMLTGKALFLTDKKLMGVGWNTVHEGDVVALMSGLEMPMILRLAEHGGYRIAGWAYIDGVMCGEAWPGAEDLDTITLV